MIRIIIITIPDLVASIIIAMLTSKQAMKIRTEEAASVVLPSS
jgi:hypothetical protein